jgi:hypothetical protein
VIIAKNVGVEAEVSVDASAAGLTESVIRAGASVTALPRASLADLDAATAHAAVGCGRRLSR